MVLAVTSTRIATYDPIEHRFTDLTVPDSVRAEVHAAADLIRRDMLHDDVAFLIARDRETPQTAQIAPPTP